ncbi:MAG: HNH endonuclease [Planctomycetes bacterium]|nr:HNH endonuclease [Planctomycetota bacterium]
MSTPTNYPSEFLALLAKITNRRAKIVVQHILRHGQVTTEELEDTYGYSHPPRAVQDVKDQGIPIVRIKVKNSSGRTIAAYRFGNPADVKLDRIGGRKAFPKGFKESLSGKGRPKCEICSTPFELRYLQIDHRVPYEIAGEGDMADRAPRDYMLLCASCQRAKSWSCEHCENWQKGRLADICERCYWATPDTHEHIALKEIRRLDIVWLGSKEIREHSRLKALAKGAKLALPLYAKAALTDHIRLRARRRTD